MYAKRNSITLFCLLLVVSLSGFFLSKKETEKLSVIQREEQNLKIKLDEKNAVIALRSDAEMKNNNLHEKWNDAPKKLVSQSEPGFTYQYLNEVLSANNIELELDFFPEKEINHETCSIYSFLLKGNGSFPNLYKLIYFFSSSPILYQIKDVNLSSLDKKSEKLSFTLRIESYSKIKDWDFEDDIEVTDPMADFNTKINFVFDSFNPLIKVVPVRENVNFSNAMVRKQSAPRDDNLLNVRNVSLEGVITDKIFVRNEAGKMITLALGERVKGGYLSRIDLNKSEAEFLMIGNSTVILGIGYVRDNGNIQPNADGRIFLR